MSTITINGVTVTGNKITIKDGRIIVDGNDVSVASDVKQINISVVGDVSHLEVDACQKVTITGNAGSVQTASGDVDVHGNITGSVLTASGDVECGGAIGTSVRTASGDVKCGNVGGNVYTMTGDITHCR